MVLPYYYCYNYVTTTTIANNGQHNSDNNYINMNNSCKNM